MKSLRTMIVMAAIMSVTCTGANARTWYIKVDGSGDAPTIQAGIDSAATGDTVLVGPGTYAISSGIYMKSNTVLRSEGGPASTIIDPYMIYGSVITFRNVTTCEMHGFWIKASYGGGYCLLLNSSNTLMVANNIIESSSYGMSVYYCDVVYIRNSLFIGENGTGEGYGITLETYGYIEIKNNIVMNDVYCIEHSWVNIRCNDVVGNPDCFPLSANFGLDPQFCGVGGAMNYYLQSNSPCAPGNDPLGGYCGLIGPLPVGCGTVDIEKKTWGEIKTLYQE